MRKNHLVVKRVFSDPHEAAKETACFLQPEFLQADSLTQNQQLPFIALKDFCVHPIGGNGAAPNHLVILPDQRPRFLSFHEIRRIPEGKQHLRNGGQIVFPGMGGQSIPYDGPLTGSVDAAIRPENIFFSTDGPLQGILAAQYYLGDTDDCRVRVGDTLVRVIVNGHEYKRLQNGQQVRLSIRDLMVFPDDGMLDEVLQIRT
jgi:hypothetical protein